MSMMTLLLAFAPSAIAARYQTEKHKDATIARLRERCDDLKRDNDWLRAEVNYLRERSPEQQQADAIYRYQMMQAANQQMLAQQQARYPYQQQDLMPVCNCVPGRAQSLLGHIGGA